MIKTDNKTTVTQLHRYTSCLLLSMLTGCGGGSNGASAISTVPPPPSVPRITAIAPADKDRCVSSNGTVTINFSSDMSAASVASAFHVSNASGAVQGTISYANQVAIFTPSSPFLNNSDYTASIDSSATDVRGNSLSTPYTWAFTTIPAATIAGNYVICWDPINDSRLSRYHLYWDTKSSIDMITPVGQATTVANSYEMSPTPLVGMTVYMAVTAESDIAGAGSALSDPIMVVVQ